MLNAYHRNDQRRKVLRCEVLEDRDLPNPLNSLMMPAGTASLSLGTLTVTDNSGAANIRIVSTGTQLQVYDGTTDIGNYSLSAVADIDVTVGGPSYGTNVVNIGMTVLDDVTINAGAGTNKLIAGGGPTVINGGSGRNEISGGALTTVNPGSGTNTIIATNPLTIVSPPPASSSTQILSTSSGSSSASTAQLTTGNVQTILNRAQAASSYNDAIIAVVDRNGNILGVRVEGGVQISPTNVDTYVFAIDGAVALARSAAMFSSDQGPLTSRTVQYISQSTITQREVDSNPNIANQESTLYGPGYVAPIGIGGHFPPGINDTPQVDLYEIEQTNREGEYIDVNGTYEQLQDPYNINSAYVPSGNTLSFLNSYGVQSGTLMTAQNRGVATLPGGVPLYLNGSLVGGVGVFFPGTNGYATNENSSLSASYNPALPDLSNVAEWMAFAAAGGYSVSTPGPTSEPADPIGAINGVPTISGLGMPDGLISLAGIYLPEVGATPGLEGLNETIALGNTVGRSNPTPADDVPVLPGGITLQAGKAVPSGWLVTPHNGVGITAAEATQIVDQGLSQAVSTRSQLRLPLNTTSQFVYAVTDEDGNIVALYRQPDAPTFSIDVAIAKARNAEYYANPSQLQPEDEVSGIPAGTAFTARTFRYLAEPRFPEGIDGASPGPFSQLNNGGANPQTGLQVGPALPESAYTSVLGYTSFHPDANFHDPIDPKNQNGVVYFPGSSALYTSSKAGASPSLVGGLGVSGDGVNQDDTVTMAAEAGYGAPASVPQADDFEVRGVRLPYQENTRNPDAM